MYEGNDFHIVFYDVKSRCSTFKCFCDVQIFIQWKSMMKKMILPKLFDIRSYLMPPSVSKIESQLNH